MSNDILELFGIGEAALNVPVLYNNHPIRQLNILEKVFYLHTFMCLAKDGKEPQSVKLYTKRLMATAGIPTSEWESILTLREIRDKELIAEFHKLKFSTASLCTLYAEIRFFFDRSNNVAGEFYPALDKYFTDLKLERMDKKVITELITSLLKSDASAVSHSLKYLKRKIPVIGEVEELLKSLLG